MKMKNGNMFVSAKLLNDLEKEIVILKAMLERK
jgi:hypothetical protein